MVNRRNDGALPIKLYFYIYFDNKRRFSLSSTLHALNTLILLDQREEYGHEENSHIGNIF